MSHYDVFNGDADGLCARQQLRLAQPRAAVLVTGPKRDIALVARVPARPGDSVTVLDISLARNRAAVQALLARGVAIEYFDHHYPGEPLVHPALHLCIDPAPGACTSALVDRHLGGRHRRWAVVGAYGDNLHATAEALARDTGLAAGELGLLRELGEAINYNAYGDSEADLLLPPARLAEAMLPFADPLAFAREPVARALAERQQQDLRLAADLVPSARLPGGCVYVLPDAPWARRVQGVFANALVRGAPAQAHAVLCEAGSQAYAVSVRAPLQRPHGADALCRAFAGGGGRAAAAGIDRLPRGELDAFLAAFARAWPAAVA